MHWPEVTFLIKGMEHLKIHACFLNQNSFKFVTLLNGMAYTANKKGKSKAGNDFTNVVTL